MNMKKKHIILSLLLVVMMSSLAFGISEPNPANNGIVLVKSYFHYKIVSEVIKAGEGITAPDSAMAEISNILKSWGKTEKYNIRSDLEKQFGKNAKDAFSFFVEHYTAAESGNDIQYLKTLTAQAGISPAPENFADLNNLVINQWLKDDITRAGALLSELQTWSGLYAKDSSIPSLKAWLERDKNLPATEPVKPSLANMEPDLPEFVELDDEEGSTMDIYDNLQSKRRAQVLKESQVYMKQIAEERKSAEEEYAQKKAAKANREAAAVKAHAQKLAAAESEIMEQRKHTWTARVSRLVTSVTGGAFSAVTSGVGSAAGAAAAQAIFD